MLGTQMLIKGHHFTKVTLVGIINVDSGLFSSDFRAVEHLGQMVVQVSGRAGRGDIKGEVMIQTYHPAHPQLALLMRDNYHEFAQQIMRERAQAVLPPYCHFAVFRALSKHKKESMKFLDEVYKIANGIESLSLIHISKPTRPY